MTGGGLQEVDQRELAQLHAGALGLAEDLRRQIAGDWRAGLDPRARAAATLVAARLSTRLMEAMNWLLTARAVAAGEIADLGPAAWHAAGPAALADGALAVSVERLYRRIMQLDSETR